MDKSFVGGLALAYAVAAANSDAEKAGKREQLRQAILPKLKQFKQDGNAEPLFDAICSVLGEEWQPTGEFAVAIDKLLEG